jgi:hypothetical protein
MAGVGPAWYPAPAPGDIVWCRFPERQLPGPGPKPRPALVIAVREFEGHPIAVVAYGTSRKVDRLYAGEFAISASDGPAFEVAGLGAPTKFDLSRTLEIDFSPYWFAVPPGAPHGQTPKLGILHPSLVRRAEAAYRAAHRARR